MIAVYDFISFPLARQSFYEVVSETTGAQRNDIVIATYNQTELCGVNLTDAATRKGDTVQYPLETEAAVSMKKKRFTAEGNSEELVPVVVSVGVRSYIPGEEAVR
jgi:hypothetical protein